MTSADDSEGRNNSFGDDWLPEAAWQAMGLERQLNPEESAYEAAKRILEENASLCAASVAHLATHGKSERIRMEASEYILERVFAWAGDVPLMSPEEQVKAVGSVLTGVLSKFGHDSSDPEVRRSVREALLKVAGEGE